MGRTIKIVLIDTDYQSGPKIIILDGINECYAVNEGYGMQ